MTSQFSFLELDFLEISQEAERAAASALTDPRTACFYSRRVAELCVNWAYKHDRSLRAPYDDNLSALINAPSFRELLDDQISKILREVVRLGNKAAHDAAPVSRFDSVAAVSGLFQFCYWFARTYGQQHKPAPGLTFDPKALPDPSQQAQSTVAELEALQEELAEEQRLGALARERLLGAAELQKELDQLRDEVARVKAEAPEPTDDHDYSEAETREFLIDLLLEEAGWDSGDPDLVREHPVQGLPGNVNGRADYVLLGGNGRPLAVIEAKRTGRDPMAGQHQAVLYADALEREFGQRPIIFYTNGYTHWIWDDSTYAPRQVQGFYTKAELERLVQRRTSRQSIVRTSINEEIVERPYQHRAIRQIAEAFEVDNDRKALLVMATGAGKTRTAIALSDVMMRARWAKRILFLADRRALVRQAVGAFKEHLPASSPVNLLTEPNTDSDVSVATYATMMGLIDEVRHGRRRFGVGHFDLIIIDEAHRSVFNKYRAIFEYFDSLLVGLTATPKSEIDRNTYGLFDLETGVPTDVYELDDAVAEGHLVPPRAYSAPVMFPLAGITFDQLSEAEQREWEGLDWSDDEDIPERVDAAALHSWLFNKSTVDLVLEHLMANGQYVEGGDRLGKTIIFARSQKHANFIVERFDVNYPAHAGKAARVITHQVGEREAEDLIKEFSRAESDMRIAVSVDMLDTGIDVPEVVNLVFFKPVRSITKFWQMMGRGTRLCKDLFGPGNDKHSFSVFDHCRNLEYFSQQVTPGNAPATASISQKLFSARIELIEILDRDGATTPLRSAVADVLRTRVASMNADNFAVRPHREAVEFFADPMAWTELDAEQRAVLVREIAPLPDGLEYEAELTKRFDLLLLNTQLAALTNDARFPQLQNRIRATAAQLRLLDTISGVIKQLELLDDIATDEWWQVADVDALETVRLALRDLVGFIQPQAQKPLYTGFADQLLGSTQVEFEDIERADSFRQFRIKAEAYLRDHLSEGAVHKIYTNEPLGPGDLDELRSIFVANGVGSVEDLDTAAERAGSFVAFVRSIIGLDRIAATKAFERFLSGDTFTANQIRFVEKIIDYLAENGSIDAAAVYRAPFTDISQSGPESLFADQDADALFDLMDQFSSD